MRRSFYLAERQQAIGDEELITLPNDAKSAVSSSAPAASFRDELFRRHAEVLG